MYVYDNTNGELGHKIHNANSGSSAYSILRMGNDISDAVMFLNSSTRTVDGGANAFTFRNDAGDLRLQALGGVAGIQIKATTGYVGIGTASPAAPLHVVGTTNAISSTAGGIFMGTFADGSYSFMQMNSTTGSYIDFSGNGDDSQGRIIYNNTSDFFDIYTNATAVARIDSTGSLTMTGDITAFGSISDVRFKENIQNIDSQLALDKVKTLRPVTFTWKDTIQNQIKRGTSDAGFIAQEVEQVVEYAVGEFTDIASGDIYKKINHERIIPYLVGAIQQLEARIAELEKQ